MAQKTVVSLVDDLDGSEADETVEFGLDGVSYELDLSEDNATALRNALSDYIEHARRSGGRRAGGGGGRRASSRRNNGSGTGGRATVDRERLPNVRRVRSGSVGSRATRWRPKTTPSAYPASPAFLAADC